MLQHPCYMLSYQMTAVAQIALCTPGLLHWRCPIQCGPKPPSDCPLGVSSGDGAPKRAILRRAQERCQGRTHVKSGLACGLRMIANRSTLMDARVGALYRFPSVTVD